MEQTTTRNAGVDPAAKARQYVQQARIPVLRGPADTTAADTVRASLDAAKNQATVVGSDAISFVTGVTPDRREAIINSSLLAQLVASANVKNRDDLEAWYNAYFDVLTNIGWVIQDKGFAEYREKGGGFDVHTAVMKVAAAVLGPASTALAIVMTTLNSLHSMNDKEPWIKIFQRNTRRAKVARFQISLAEQEANGQFIVNLMAFRLEANLATTQVLFFKTQSEDATLRHNTGRVTINTTVLDAVREAISQKLVGRSKDFVSKLPDLPDLDELPEVPDLGELPEVSANN